MMRLPVPRMQGHREFGRKRERVLRKSYRGSCQLGEDLKRGFRVKAGGGKEARGGGGGGEGGRGRGRVDFALNRIGAGKAESLNFVLSERGQRVELVAVANYSDRDRS